MRFSVFVLALEDVSLSFTNFNELWFIVNKNGQAHLNDHEEMLCDDHDYQEIDGRPICDGTFFAFNVDFPKGRAREKDGHAVSHDAELG